MSETTPGHWAWDDNELFGSDGALIVISAGMNKDGSRFVRVSDEDKPLIAAAPDMREALTLAGAHMNKLNALVVRFLTDRIGKEEFIGGCIELSDGPDRKIVAAATNAALAKANGESS